MLIKTAQDRNQSQSRRASGETETGSREQCGATVQTGYSVDVRPEYRILLSRRCSFKGLKSISWNIGVQVIGQYTSTYSGFLSESDGMHDLTK